MALPPEEFATVALPLLDQVHTVARYLARNPSDAEDLVQETYLRAHRFWHQFTPGTNCKAWLLTILHNVHRQRFRSSQREPSTVELEESGFDPARSTSVAPPAATPEESVLATMLDEEVEAALRSLPPDFLDVVVLVDVQELSYEEAAAAIGCPIGTVRSRLARGRALLHAHLLEYARARGLVRG
jgi:RNA polymerase sigma-70 factor (ECF subfamily)